MSTNSSWNRRIPMAAWLAASLVCAMPIAVRAQEQPAPPTPQAAPPAAPQPGVMIKKESKLVLVDAVVTDKKGKYVHDLTQAISKFSKITRSSRFLLFPRVWMRLRKRTGSGAI